MSIGHIDAVLHHSKARGTDKLILIGIASHDGDGGSWPSIERLAVYANVDKRTARRSIRNLEALGEVRVTIAAGGTMQTRNDRRPNRYDVLVKCPAGCPGAPNHDLQHRDTREDVDVPPSPVHNSAPRGDAHDRSSASRGDAGVLHGGTPTSSEPSLEPIPPNPRERGNQVRPHCPQHRRWRGACADCRAALDPPKPRPPWCGSCDEQTRLYERRLNADGDFAVERCRRCHPLTQSDRVPTEGDRP